jgi:AraC family transcriptional regulator, transcriptional activator of pobA
MHLEHGRKASSLVDFRPWLECIMTGTAPLLIVPFREVRHFQPDDCLHYEPIELRGRQHGWNIPVHAHETLYQFEFLEHGTVAANLDGYCHRLMAPAAWMVPPGVIHGFVFGEDSSGHVITVPADMLRHGSRAERGGAPAQPVVLDAQHVEEHLAQLRNMFEALATEFGAQLPRRAGALQAQAVILEIWFSRHESAATSRARRTDHDALVQRFRSLLERHYRDHWSVADYAARLAITPDYLSRRCRIVTGQSAIELISERVLLESRRLLAYTQMSITDIAHQIGFDDPAYFSRFFAKSAGCAPSIYRGTVTEGLGPLPPRE